MATVTPTCPRINTTRLKSITQRFNRATMTITDSGHIVMEIKTPITGQCVEVTKEVVRISPDGSQIEVYRSLQIIEGHHDFSQPDQIYIYPDMPDKLWRKYLHAYKFVEVIKSRTVKVTLITDRARCKLMENSPCADFQVCFTAGVTLVLSKCQVTITDKNGSTLSCSEDLASSHVSPNSVALLKYSQQCRDVCLKIEQSVNNLPFSAQSDHDVFPIIVGSNNQPCVLPDSIPVSSSHPDLAIDKSHCHPENVWSTPSNQANHLLYLPDCCNDAKFINQSECSVQSHEIKQNANKLKASFIKQQLEKNCTYEQTGNIICAPTNSHNLYEITSFRNILDEQYFNPSLPSDEDVYNSLPENYKIFENFNSIVGGCLNQRKCQSSLTPQKSNTPNISPQPFYSQSLEQLVACCQDDVADRYVDNDDSGQQDKMPDKPSFNLVNSLAHGLEAECNISRNVDKSCSTSAKSYTNCIMDKQKLLPLSPLSTIIPNENIYNQFNQAMFSSDLPEFNASRFQNNYSTPQKSSIAFDSCLFSGNKNSMKNQNLNKSMPYNYEVDQTCLQNVRRNLFSDHKSADTLSSKSSSSSTSISTQSEMLDLSEAAGGQESGNLKCHDFVFIENSSHAVNSQGDGFINPSLNPDNQHLFFKNQVLVSENKDPGLQRQPLSSNSNSASTQLLSPKTNSASTQPVNNSLAIATLCSPLNFPNIKSVLKCSSCPCTPEKSQAKLLSFNTSLDPRRITSNCQLEHFNNYDGCSVDSSENSMAILVEEDSGCDVPAFQPQIQQLNPENCTTPKKPAPVRKIAGSSPQKTPIKLYENKFHKNVSDPSQLTDLAPWVQKFSTTKNNFMNSAAGSLSPTNIISSRNMNHPWERLKSPELDRTISRQSSAVPSSREIPFKTQAVNNWSNAPLLSHLHNSLDVSSDGYSSPPSSASDVLCQVFVPYTGWASFYATGTVWILYNDGTQLGVKSTEAIMVYVDQEGTRNRYSNADIVPEIVKLKLERLPKIIDLLMSQATNFQESIL